MALWKAFRGNRAALDTVEKHDGYVYWCLDDSSLHFDYADENGNLHRKQINAKTLTDVDSLDLIAPEDIDAICGDTIEVVSSNEAIF